MFVRFIDENTIEEAPNVIKGNGIYIANPLPETLTEHGYKPLEVTEPDGDAAEGYHWEFRYVELDDKVVKTWVQVENPVHEVIEEPIEEQVEEPIEQGGE